MNKFKLLFCVISLTLFASACQTTTHFGEGQLKLSPRVANYFESFINDRNARRFYASDDGSYANYSYCRDTSCSERARAKIVSNCNKNASPAKCYMLANKNEITWNNPGNFMPYDSNAVLQAYGKYFSKDREASNSHTNRGTLFSKSGKGQVKLSESASENFIKFLKDKDASYFLASSDVSKFGILTCSVHGCSEQQMRSALETCEQKSSSETRCYPFATQNKILWSDSGNFLNVKSELVNKKFGNYFFSQN